MLIVINCAQSTQRMNCFYFLPSSLKFQYFSSIFDPNPQEEISFTLQLPTPLNVRANTVEQICDPTVYSNAFILFLKMEVAGHL